jgi:hypothetical protein
MTHMLGQHERVAVERRAASTCWPRRYLPRFVQTHQDRLRSRMLTRQPGVDVTFNKQETIFLFLKVKNIDQELSVSVPNRPLISAVSCDAARSQAETRPGGGWLLSRAIRDCRGRSENFLVTKSAPVV